MKTAYFISLTAFAVGMSAATLEARPTDKSIAETRLKLDPRSSDIRYMNFNTQKQNGCSTYVDAGENRSILYERDNLTKLVRVYQT